MVVWLDPGLKGWLFYMISNQTRQRSTVVIENYSLLELCVFYISNFYKMPLVNTLILKSVVETKSKKMLTYRKKIIDEDGIRTHAPRGKWISSPSP